MGDQRELFGQVASVPTAAHPCHRTARPRLRWVKYLKNVLSETWASSMICCTVVIS